MTPLQIADKYAEAIFKGSNVDRYMISRKVGNTMEEAEAINLAKEALWLTAVENPKASIPNILLQARKLYSRWLREDYLPLFAQQAMEKRNNNKVLYEDYIVWPSDKCELADEVYNCLDTIIKTYGIHLGLWAILSYFLADSQSKSQTIYRKMNLQPTGEEEKRASLIINKFKKIFMSHK